MGGGCTTPRINSGTELLIVDACIYKFNVDCNVLIHGVHTDYLILIFRLGSYRR